MRYAHATYAHFALHKTERTIYIETISRAQEIAERLETRNSNSGLPTPPPRASRLRLTTLLLPVVSHLYDARRTSSRGGRYSFKACLHAATHIISSQSTPAIRPSSRDRNSHSRKTALRRLLHLRDRNAPGYRPISGPFAPTRTHCHNNRFS